MKTTVKILKSGLFMLILIFASCTKEGPQGPVGPSGIDGIDGTDGTNGVDGNDGTNGTNGTNGTDGEDGNANVVSFTFDITAASGTSHQLNNTTAAVYVEDGAVLAYVRAADTWYQVPNQRVFTNGFSFIDIASEFVPNGNSYFFKLNFLREGAPLVIGAGELDELRLVLIGTNSSSGKSSDSALDKLYDAGIDLSDYHQVMEYYGLKE